MPIEKNHRRLLLAVCTALFFMPFMMAGVNAVLPPLADVDVPVLPPRTRTRQVLFILWDWPCSN